MKTLSTKLILCAVLFLTVQTSEAQYRKLIFGERNPFDTAIAVQINRYRTEGLYIKRSKIVIDSLNSESRILTREIDSLYSELRFKNLHIRNDSVKFKTLSLAYDTLSGNVNKLSLQFDRLAEQKKKWTWREWTVFSILALLAGKAAF